MQWKTLRRLWRALRSDPVTAEKLVLFRRDAVRALSWLAGVELLMLLEVYPIKMFVDALTNQKRLSWGLGLPAFMALLVAGVVVLYGLSNYVDTRMDIARNSAAWLFWVILDGHGTRKQLSLGADWHVAHSSSKKESVLSKNLKKVDYMLDNFYFDIIPLTVRMCFIAVGTCFIGWQFGLVAIVTMTAYLLHAFRTERKLKPLRQDYREYTSRIERSDSELASTALTIKELGLEDELGTAHEELLMEHWQKEVPRHTKFRFLIWRQDNIIVLSRALFLVLAYWSWQGGHGLTLGTIVLAYTWIEQIYHNIWRYGAFQHTLNEGATALEEMVSLFETEPTLKAPETPEWPRQVRGRVELRNLTFTYPGTSRPALQNIDLLVEAGMTVALVGPSGGGKTTLARLIQHQYDPNYGSVLVDGVDLRRIDDKRYRREVLGTVPQDPGLFDRSVAENIANALQDATHEQIVVAAKQAHAAPFIEALPQGYDTLVGERGVMLSGGQRQRVAIARALLRDARIRVLDEPTSALDAESQQAIKETLEELANSRAATTFIIAHRFSTIEMADLVVVMEAGRITEVGTHAELMKHDGLYMRLRRLEGLVE